MSLTRQMSRLIWDITIMIVLLIVSSEINPRRLSRHIRVDERGALNSWESVIWLRVSEAFFFSYFRRSLLNCNDLM